MAGRLFASVAGRRSTRARSRSPSAQLSGTSRVTLHSPSGRRDWEAGTRLPIRATSDRLVRSTPGALSLGWRNHQFGAQWPQCQYPQRSRPWCRCQPGPQPWRASSMGGAEPSSDIVDFAGGSGVAWAVTVVRASRPASVVIVARISASIGGNSPKYCATTIYTI